jgi:hypothetical protein
MWMDSLDDLDESAGRGRLVSKMIRLEDPGNEEYLDDIMFALDR